MKNLFGFISLALVILLSACSGSVEVIEAIPSQDSPPVIVGDDSETEKPAEDPPEAFAEGGEEDPVEEEAPQECESISIADENATFHKVGSFLSFELNPDSPKGKVGDGLQKVIIIDAFALCGDIVLEGILFQTTGDASGWMSHVHEVTSAIEYIDPISQAAVFAAYGDGQSHETYSSVTGLYWDHEFQNPIEIKKGEKFTFSLAVTYGGSVVPPGTFDFNLYARHRWYGLDDPGAYPDPVTGYGVMGNELSYAP